MPTFPIAGPSNEGSVPKVLNIFDVSSEFLGQLKTWLEQNPPSIPITQIIGFSGFTAQYERVDTSESTSSTAYADLATPGPSITGLAAGQYVLVYGAVADISSSVDTALLSPSVDGVAPTNGIAAWTSSTTFASVMSASLATITANGTVKLQYAVTPAGTGTFLNRWLIVLKFAN